jgi:hypothetical protein
MQFDTRHCVAPLNGRRQYTFAAEMVSSLHRQVMSGESRLKSRKQDEDELDEIGPSAATDLDGNLFLSVSQ